MICGNVLEILSGWNLLFLTIAFVSTILWQRSRRPVDLPPGPTPFPVIGNFHSLLFGDLLWTTRGLSKEYGSIFSLSLGSHWTIFINNSKMLYDIFVTHADEFSGRPAVFFFRDMLDYKGIVASSGHLWKQQRTFALNALKHFGFGKKSIENKIIEEVQCFVEFLQESKEQAVCIENNIQNAVGNITCSIVFGKRFSYDDETFLRLSQGVHDILANPFLPVVNWIPLMHTMSRIVDIFGTQKSIDLVKDLKRDVAEIIKEHRRTLDENEPRDFIDVYLLEWQKCDKDDPKFSEGNLEAVVLELFAAGTDTTATSILWIILYLVNYPDVQEKMHREISDNVGVGRQPRIEHRQSLPYCEAVLCEAQRLGNVSPFSMGHTASMDVVIGKYRIPKDSIVIPNLNSALHDENVFKNPDTFDPCRFLNDNGEINELRQHWLPFSIGRRSCLGESLAKMELFLFTTTIVSRYRITPIEGEPPPKIEVNIGLNNNPGKYEVCFVDR